MRPTRSLLNRYSHWIFIVVLLVSSQVATAARSAASMSQSPTGDSHIPDSPASIDNSARSASAAKPFGGGGDTYQWYCWPDGSPDPCHNSLYAVDSVDSNLAWAVGEMGTALRWDGVAWTKVQKTPTDKDLLDVDIMSGGAVWAVGQDGTILRGNGTQWELMTSPVTQTLKAVQMINSSIGWAVGEQGVILSWDGGSWIVQKAADGNNLNALAMLSPTNGYAVGVGGVVYHWNGSTWLLDIQFPFGYADLVDIQAKSWEEIYVSSKLTGGNACDLVRYNLNTHQTLAIGPMCSVSALGLNNVWGIEYPGGNSNVLHWDGLETKSILSAYGLLPFYGLSMIPGNDGWLVGYYGLIMRWDGYRWNMISNGYYMDGVSVGLSSVNDGWIVGGSGRIMHWDGNRPKSVPSPATGELVDVSVLPDGQAWALSPTGEILHWDQTAWQVQSTLPVTESLTTLQMISPSEGWAAGGSTFLHWDGLAWTKSTQSTGCQINDLALLSVDSGWAAGFSSITNQYCLLRYQGGVTWNLYGYTYGTSYWGGPARLSMLSESDGWFIAGATLWRWDGQNWNSFYYNLPANSYQVSIAIISSTDGWLSTTGGVFRWNGVEWLPWHGGEYLLFTDIAMLSSNYGVGVSGSGFYEWDGVNWRNRVFYPYYYGDIGASSSRDVWIPGIFGVNDPGVIHFDGTDWSGMPSSNENLGVIEALDATHAWAGGGGYGACYYDDCILSWDGTAWQITMRSIRGSVLGIDAFSTNDVWVLGGQPYWDAGTDLYHWNGTDWQVMFSSPLNLNAFDMISDNDGWALSGGYPDVYHWDGSNWLTYTLPTPGGAYCLSAVGTGDVWIGGVINNADYSWSPGTWHWNGFTWTAVSVPGSGIIKKIDMLSATDGWAIGDGDEIWHWDGNSWLAVDSPIRRPISGLKMLSANDGWAVGEGGVILRYGPPPDQMPADPQQSTISASPSQVPADGTSQAVISVTLRGADGLPLPGKHVYLTSNRPEADLVQQPELATDTNGQTHGSVASLQVGSSIIQAMVLDGAILGQAVEVQFTSLDLVVRDCIVNLFQTSNNKYASLQQIAVDSANLGDYLRDKVNEEDIKWTLDLALLMLDGADKVAGLEKEAAKINFPGLGKNWNDLTDFKNQTVREAGNMWHSGLKDIIQNEDWTAFPELWKDSGWMYFQSRVKSKLVEEVTEDELFDLYGALIDNYYPSWYDELANIYKNDTQEFRDALVHKTAETLAALPALTPEQEALYIQDLRARYMVPTDLWLNHYTTYNMIQGVHDVMEKAGADPGQVALQEILAFLAKFAAKSFFTAYLDGAGPLLVDGGDFILKSAIYYPQRSAMMQALSEVPSLLNNLPATDLKIYSNATSAYSNILEQNPVSPAQVQVGTVFNFSMSNPIDGLENYQAESESFSYFNLTNTGSEPTVYEVYGQYGYWIDVLGRHYFYIPTMAQTTTVELNPGDTRLLYLYYKQGPTGASPEHGSTVTIRILGTNQWGTYHVATKQVTWDSPLLISDDRAAVGYILNPQDYPRLPDNVTIVPNPIDLYVGQDAANPAYQGFVLVENPFTQTITAQITYTLPAQTSVLATDGFIYTDTHSIRWSLRLEPGDSQMLSFRLGSSATPGEPLLFPPAQMSFRFDDQPQVMQSESNPVQTDGLWPLKVTTDLGYAAPNQGLPVSVTITSTTPTEIDATLVITFTDGKGNPLNFKELPFTLTDQGSALIHTELPGQPFGNYLVEFSVRIGENTRQYDQMVYIIKQYSMFLPALVKGVP